jgi:hypothetical protein
VEGHSGDRLIEPSNPGPRDIVIILVTRHTNQVKVSPDHDRLGRCRYRLSKFPQELVRTSMISRSINHEEAPLHFVVPLIDRGTDEEVPLLPLPNLKAIIPKT